MLLLSIIAFALTMVFAYVVGGWAEAVRTASPSPDRAGEEAAAERVSLIIPARNAEETLPALLQDLHAQHWPKEAMEVLVVDDGSTDGTAALVEGMARTWAGLRLIPAKGEGKKTAIAHGVAMAASDWVILTDADARCGPHRVRGIMQAVQDKQPDLLLMPVAVDGEGWLQRLQIEEQAALMGVAAGTAMQGYPVLANGANMAFRKQAFEAVGGYQGDRWASGDDIFLLRRMRKSGRRVDYLLDARAVVTVQAEGTLRAFWSQRLRWAGKMRGLGLGMVLPALGVLLPWFLLHVSCSITPVSLMGQRPLAVLLFLASAWMLWLLPVLVLAGAAHRFLGAAPHCTSRAGHRLPTFLALLAFNCYAPFIALASLVFRPRWKGRRL